MNRIRLLERDSIVVSAGNDGVMNYWSIEAGEYLGSLELAGRIVQMGVSHGCDKMAAASYGTVHLMRPVYTPT